MDKTGRGEVRPQRKWDLGAENLAGFRGGVAFKLHCGISPKLANQII